MSDEKAGFFFHVYFYRNKKKHVGYVKFGNYTMLSAFFAPLREDLL